MEKLKRLLESRKKTYVEKTPNDAYREVAGEFDHFEPEDIAAIGGLESQHGKYSKPLKGGSARGLFQFQPETAEDLIEGSSDKLLDRNTQIELMKKYLEKNQAGSPEEAYVKHNLGKRGGTRLLSADDATPIRNILPERVIKANPGLYDVETVGQAKENIRKKLAEGKESADIRPSILDLFKGE